MKVKLRILGIGAVVVLLLTMVAGAIGTGAWFTDQDVLGPNSLVAGTVNPRVKGLTFEISSAAAPGEMYGPFRVTFANDTDPNNLPVKYKISAKPMQQSVAGFYNKLNVVAYRRVNGRLSEVYRGPLSSMVIDPSMDPAMGNVAQGESHQWIFEFGIDSSAGNIYQGATLQFSLVYDSTQTGNPNWAE